MHPGPIAKPFLYLSAVGFVAHCDQWANTSSESCAEISGLSFNDECNSSSLRIWVRVAANVVSVSVGVNHLFLGTHEWYDASRDSCLIMRILEFAVESTGLGGCPSFGSRVYGC